MPGPELAVGDPQPTSVCSRRYEAIPLRPIRVVRILNDLTNHLVADMPSFTLRHLLVSRCTGNPALVRTPA